MLPQASTISSIVRESPTVLTLELEGDIQAAPGQFLMIWLPGVDEKPFSLMSDSPLSVTIARVGPFTERVHDLEIGSKLMWRGPFGHGFRVPERGGLLLIGGGYGVVPLHFLAQVVRGRELSVAVLIGARAKEDLLFVERFRSLGCDVRVATEDGSQGTRGLVTDLMKDEPDDLTVCACGPEPMLAAVADRCGRMGIEGQFCLERYMKCGIGICGQCAFGDRLVCSDGPVFTSSQLLEIEDFGEYERDATGRRTPISGERS
jgi:dihydroorotate dehydrogenase electron transfer subunit